MFDEIERELRKLSEPRTISVELALDDRGYYDRVCPSADCGGQFKVFFEDWRDEVSDERAFCPFCRHEAPSGSWDTTAQERYIQSVADSEVSHLLNDAFERAARRTRPRRLGGELIDISMNLSYRPGRNPPVIPATATDELEQEFACEVCGCRYASLGASFFCPACGHNSAASCFDNTCETVRKTISALPALLSVLEATVNADAATDAVRQMREDQLPRLVGAFERLNEALLDELPNESQYPRKGSVFQRLDEASSLWQQATGKGYDEYLNQADSERLNLLMQRRHVLAHRQGIVDERYVKRSGDTNYHVGQRLVVTDDDVRELLRLIEQLTSGLQELV